MKHLTESDVIELFKSFSFYERDQDNLPEGMENGAIVAPYVNRDEWGIDIIRDEENNQYFSRLSNPYANDNWVSATIDKINYMIDISNEAYHHHVTLQREGK